MTQVTIPIAASGDDGRSRKTGTSYPPGTNNGSETTATDVEIRKAFATPNYHTYNGFLRFGTGAIIPTSAVIVSAVLRFINGTGTDTDGRNLELGWYPWTTFSESDVVESVGTSAAVVSVASVVAPGNPVNNLSLTDPDANIAKGGSLFTGIRMGISGAATTGENQVFIRSFDHATVNEPQLIVDYNEFQGTSPVAWITA